MTDPTVLPPEIADVLAGTRRWGLVHGESGAVLSGIPSNTFDACSTDAPYGLGKQVDVMELLRAWLAGEEYDTGPGFMGKRWDRLPGPRIWREVFRVLKPGAHCFVFAGSRTVDLMGLALRMAGFEIRDTFGWVYGQGQPHGLDLAKAIDKALGVEQEVVGTRVLQGTAALSCSERGGTHSVNVSGAGKSKEIKVTRATSELAKKFEGWNVALKPGLEPIILARKPLGATLAENVMRWGTGGLHIDACRVATDWSDRPDSWKRSGHSAKPDADKIGGNIPGIGINCHELGRYPANLLLCHLPSCSEDECAPGCPVREMDEQGGERTSGEWKGQLAGAMGPKHGTTHGNRNAIPLTKPSDSGTASRYFNQFRWSEADVPFFYCAKANNSDRNRGLDDEHCQHVTVKPQEEERWRCRLVTPPGGLILDPFAGVCSGGRAALLEGFRWLGIELCDSDEYPFVRQGRERMLHVLDERPAEEKKPRFGKASQGRLF